MEPIAPIVVTGLFAALGWPAVSWVYQTYAKAPDATAAAIVELLDICPDEWTADRDDWLTHKSGLTITDWCSRVYVRNLTIGVSPAGQRAMRKARQRWLKQRPVTPNAVASMAQAALAECRAHNAEGRS